MPDRLYPEGRPALTATINLAGNYEPSIDTHSEDAGAHISLGLGMIVLVFLDQVATDVYRRAWLTEMSLYRRVLPTQVALDKTAAPPIGLTARIRGTETPSGHIPSPAAHRLAANYERAKGGPTVSTRRAAALPRRCLPGPKASKFWPSRT